MAAKFTPVPPPCTKCKGQRAKMIGQHSGWEEFFCLLCGAFYVAGGR